jgi:Tol biopolymer transport system component
MNLDGTAARALTDDAFFEREPTWNGRGDRVVFQSNRGGQVDLWEIDPRTRLATQLTSGEFEEIPESVSRDGSVITFQRQSYAARLWAWDAGDLSGRQLTQDAMNDYSPVVAANGGLIAFQRTDPTPAQGYAIIDAKLMLGPFRDGSLVGAVRSNVEGFAPSLSADGAWLAFLQPSDRPPRSRLQVRQLAGGLTTLLAAHAEAPILSSFPVDWASSTTVWSRAGDALFFVEREDRSEIRRFTVGQATADAPLARAASPLSLIRDLYPSADDKRLGYLTASPADAAGPGSAARATISSICVARHIPVRRVFLPTSRHPSRPQGRRLMSSIPSPTSRWGRIRSG